MVPAKGGLVDFGEGEAAALVGVLDMLWSVSADCCMVFKVAAGQAYSKVVDMVVEGTVASGRLQAGSVCVCHVGSRRKLSQVGYQAKSRN
jgi:hypothetical protein